MPENLWTWSAGQLAEAIRSRLLSSREVVQAHLDRIATVNPNINAIIHLCDEPALAAANAADRAVAAGDELGALHGVPFTIKDVFDQAGTPNTFGIVSLKDQVCDRDVPVVAHMRAAGAIPIGRTNVPDWGLRWHTENDLFGATLNPWDETRTPGGSSGGEAAAIATGMSPLGIGGDMGGSLRYPAQCCGIAALKPGLGRISRTISYTFSGAPKFYEQMACVNGSLARSVADLRLALSVLSQPDPADPDWSRPPNLDSPKQARVAVVTEPGGNNCETEIAGAIQRAADLLADAGYDVMGGAPPHLEQTTSILARIANAETQSYIDDMVSTMSEPAGQYLRELVNGTEASLESYMSAIAERHRIARDWRIFMQDHPLILGPVSTMQPFKVGFDIAGPQNIEILEQSFTLTEAANLLGLPSVAVPVQFESGLPQGVQLIGRRWHEELCLDAAEFIQRSTGTFTPIETCFSD